MNIAMILDMAADAFPDRVAIGELTYADVREAARAIAARLADHPEQPTTVASVLPNGDHLSAALFGSAWAGASFAPLNFRLPEEAQDRQFARLQPAVHLDPLWMQARVDSAASSWVEAPDRPAVLLFTSGTSAEPKTASLGHDNLTSYLFNTLDFGSAAEDEAVLLAVPPFHIAGVAAVLSSTFVGRRIVPMARFEARAWLDLVNAERVTHAFLVPTMVARIVDLLREDPSLRPATLRSLAYGGARMPRPVLERALELFPEADFVNAYGLTETASTVAVLGPDDHREAAASTDETIRRRLQSIGRAVPGVELVFVEGELLVRGSQVSGKYVGAEGKVDGDGWLHTGDSGFVDEAGYVFIEGRADDMIIRGGENLSPAEIEDAILRHPGVSAVAVVGLPDDEWGQRVAAMVVPVKGATVDRSTIQGWVKDLLGSIKTPSDVTITAELPMGPTGKVLRREVRQMLHPVGASEAAVTSSP